MPTRYCYSGVFLLRFCSSSKLCQNELVDTGHRFESLWFVFFILRPFLETKLHPVIYSKTKICIDIDRVKLFYIMKIILYYLLITINLLIFIKLSLKSCKKIIYNWIIV
ncbi:hypothetical protein AAZV13_04G199900 [Glycine max]